MSVLADHVAVLLLELATRSNGTLSYFIADLPDAVERRFGIRVPITLIEQANTRLTELGGVTRLSSPLTGDMYRLAPRETLFYFSDDGGPNENTSAAYDRRWEKAHKDFPIFKTYYHGGEVWFNRALEALAERNLFGDEAEQDFDVSSSFAPASDRIVTFDHNLPDAQKLDEGLPELADLVREDNSATICNAEDRPRIIEQLKAAHGLLKLSRVSTKAISSLLLPILTYLSIKFADEAIGELASALIEALKNLLGISF